jgi:hypothetical protein
MKAALWGVLACAVCVLLTARVAQAWTVSAHRVVLLTTEGETNPVALELTARVRGELVASSLDVVLLTTAPATELRIAVETMATELDPAAVIAVRYVPPVTPEEAAGADVWISDRLSHTTLMQVAHVQMSERQPAARLAVLIAEILRARLSLPWVETASPEAATPPPPKPVVVEAPPLAPSETAPAEETRGRISLGGGAGLSHYFRNGNSTWFPALQLGYEPSSSGIARPWVRFNATWTPQENRVQYAHGSIHARETTLLLQGVLRFAPSAVVQPLLSVGIGAVGVQLRGEAEAPYEASHQNTWSGANSFGGGLWLQPSEGVVWLLEAQALAAWAPTHARVEGVTVARWGFPGLLFSASVLGRY